MRSTPSGTVAISLSFPESSTAAQRLDGPAWETGKCAMPKSMTCRGA